MPRTDALSSTARGPAGSRSSVEAISARSDPGSAVLSGCDAGHRRQFGEEQRVAAAAFVELVDEAPRCCPSPSIASTSTWASSRDSGSSGMRIVIGWSVAGGQSMSMSSRWAVITSTAPVDERPGDPTEQVDHEPVGPLQVVEPHDDRAVLRAPAQALDDHGEQRLAGPRRGHRIERRRMAQQVQHGLDEQVEHRVVGVEAVVLDALAAGSTWRSTGDRRRRIELHPPEQRRRRSAPTRCSRRTARRSRRTRPPIGSGTVCSISLTSRVLPDPASPVTATTALRPFATIDITDDSNSRWLARPTNGHVGARADRRHAPLQSGDAARPARTARGRRTSMSSTKVAHDLVGGERRRWSRRCRPHPAAPSSAAATPRSRRRPSRCTRWCRQRYRPPPHRC